MIRLVLALALLATPAAAEAPGIAVPHITGPAHVVDGDTIVVGREKVWLPTQAPEIR